MSIPSKERTKRDGEMNIGVTYKSKIACQTAASSNKIPNLRSMTAGSRPISDTLIGSRGFPVALAMLSGLLLACVSVL